MSEWRIVFCFVAPTECKMPPRGGIPLWTPYLRRSSIFHMLPYTYIYIHASNLKLLVADDRGEWTGGYKMNRLTLKDYRLKFKISGTLPVVVEESIEYTTM
jgi:hypothetical protein